MNQFPYNRDTTPSPSLSTSNTKPSYDSGMTTTSTTATSSNDNIESTNELSSLQCKHLMQHKCYHPPSMLDHHYHHHDHVDGNNAHSWRMEVDGVQNTGTNADCRLTCMEICSTALSVLMRAVAVCINIKLAVDYYRQGHQDYFVWTIVCIVTPMVVTILIHANMCYQDGKLSNGYGQIFQTLFLVILSSFFFRYWKSLMYAIKCKRAELIGDKQTQLLNYKLNVREESDVAFIRLFECFLEAAPQKILQISIVLGHKDKMFNLQIIAIISYFGSMAWCLSVYHRYNRYSQSDKYNISSNGVILQLCWHFCISVSRTLCIAFVASILPLWTVIACMGHALVFGLVAFVVDRPKFARSSVGNFLFCLVLGFVYIFTYISVRDAPTRYKYLIYYVICSMENVICVAIFILNASTDLISNGYLFYPLCVIALAFYYIGIVFMIIYYLYFHPRITARTSKRINN